MKRLNWMVGFFILSLLVGCVTGSGGNSSELNQLAEEAALLGKAELQTMAAKYKGLLSEKIDVVDALKTKLKEIPLAELMGEKAISLKQELGETTTLISQLKDKLAVYTDALKALK